MSGQKKSSQFVSAFDISARIWKSLVNSIQDAGGSDEDIRRIETSVDLRKKIAELVVGGVVADALTIIFDPTKPFGRDMRNEEWTLENPKSEFAGKAGPLTLELCEFLKPGEGSVNGEEMVRRAIKDGADLGQKHAEAFLAKYERWAPPEGVYYIAFPGTIWRSQGGDRRVPFLDWDGDRWSLGFGWLGGGWSGCGRLLRPRKSFYFSPVFWRGSFLFPRTKQSERRSYPNAPSKIPISPKRRE